MDDHRGCTADAKADTAVVHEQSPTFEAMLSRNLLRGGAATSRSSSKGLIKQGLRSRASARSSACNSSRGTAAAEMSSVAKLTYSTIAGDSGANAQLIDLTDAAKAKYEVGHPSPRPSVALGQITMCILLLLLSLCRAKARHTL